MVIWKCILYQPGAGTVCRELREGHQQSGTHFRLRQGSHDKGIRERRCVLRVSDCCECMAVGGRSREAPVRTRRGVSLGACVCSRNQKDKVGDIWVASTAQPLSHDERS